MKARPWWCLAIFLAMATLANARGDDSWIGRRVFTRYGTVLKLGNRVLDDEGRAASLASSGIERRENRTYRVEYVNGDWLWLRAEKTGISGWVRSRYVIPLEQAIDYYTQEIRAYPSSSAYLARGTIWAEKGEYDIAIADYTEAIQLDPKSAPAHNNRGNAWLIKEQYDKAIADLNEAIRIDPRFDAAYNNRGNAYRHKLQYDKAIADYDETIRINPKSPWPHNNRGIAHRARQEYDRAIADFNEAIRLNPSFTLAYVDRGATWEDKNESDKAIADYTQAIRLDPRSAVAHNIRGHVRTNKEEFDRAIVDFNEAILIDPKLVIAYKNRAYAWASLKEPINALADYNEVVRLDPKSAWAYNARAWLLATSPDPKVRDGRKAVESAKHACDLDDWEAASDLGTLAAAYAESGDFDKAVEWQTKANKLYDDDKARKQGEDRLKLYREKKPYRDER